MTTKWRQKYGPLQVIEPLTEKTYGRGCLMFDEQKNKEQNGEIPLKRGYILNELSTEATHSKIFRILYILRKPNAIIAK